jgi:hypothetical protein
VVEAAAVVAAVAEAAAVVAEAAAAEGVADKQTID